MVSDLKESAQLGLKALPVSNDNNKATDDSAKMIFSKVVRKKADSTE